MQIQFLSRGILFIARKKVNVPGDTISMQTGLDYAGEEDAGLHVNRGGNAVDGGVLEIPMGKSMSHCV